MHSYPVKLFKLVRMKCNFFIPTNIFLSFYQLVQTLLPPKQVMIFKENFIYCVYWEFIYLVIFLKKKQILQLHFHVKKILN